MVAVWLGEAQRRLCVAGPILKSYFRGSSQQDVEITSLPAPDFIKICRIDVRRSGSVNKRLRPMRLLERTADRTSVSGDIPTQYCVWSGVDGSGNAKKGLMFDKNFGSSGTNDLYIWIRQYPKEPVDGGQAMEISDAWCDVCLDYAEMMARGRMASMDKDQVSLARIAEGRWNQGMALATDYTDPEYDDEPITVTDETGAMDEEWPA